MTENLIPKYQRLLDELGETDFGQKERVGLVAFLSRSDITENDLQKLVSVYQQGIEEGVLETEYVNHPVFRWVGYVSDFDRFGTIKSGLSREEIVAVVKANRAAILNRDTRYSPV